MRNRYLLGAGVALAVALSWADARAQLLVPPSGPGAWYFGGEVGWTHLDPQKGALALTAGGATTVKENWNEGFNAGARAGYEWGPWRFEEEFRFQTNGLHSLTLVPNASLAAVGVPGGTSTLVKGDRNAYAIMTNAIYDFAVGWAVTPHIGGGIGAVVLHDSAHVKPGSVIFPPGALFASSSRLELGFQGIAGIRYNINPSLAFDLDYRYLGTTDPTFGSVLGKYKSGYSTHNVVASLSVRFGAPAVIAPPAPPAPPPLARRVFLVFFDWDKSTITPEGMAIIQQAAAAFRAGGPVTIQVTGYTDASGSAGYNQRLSERRANAVAQAMVGLGVPRQQMAVSGRGKNDQRVPTADGVREPQNRRVEIVFP
jgi:outer membrane protein OmpA-like peptidoglycan-associated protein/opacity protein-like surface antigen